MCCWWKTTKSRTKKSLRRRGCIVCSYTSSPAQHNVVISLRLLRSLFVSNKHLAGQLSNQPFHLKPQQSHGHRRNSQPAFANDIVHGRFFVRQQLQNLLLVLGEVDGRKNTGLRRRGWPITRGKQVFKLAQDILYTF